MTLHGWLGTKHQASTYLSVQTVPYKLTSDWLIIDNNVRLWGWITGSEGQEKEEQRKIQNRPKQPWSLWMLRLSLDASGAHLRRNPKEKITRSHQDWFCRRSPCSHPSRPRRCAGCCGWWCGQRRRARSRAMFCGTRDPPVSRWQSGSDRHTSTPAKHTA